jgi:hypothetical protein
MVTLHEGQYTFLIISHPLLLRTNNVSDKRCRENWNTHLCSIIFFLRKLYRLWDNGEKFVQGRPQTTIWCMLIACWIPGVTNTHSDSVIHIAFPLQQWLHECALCYNILTLLVLLYYTVHFFITLSSSYIPICRVKVTCTSKASISHLYFLIFHHLLHTCPCLWKHLFQFNLLTFLWSVHMFAFLYFLSPFWCPFLSVLYGHTTAIFISFYGMTSGLTL